LPRGAAVAASVARLRAEGVAEAGRRGVVAVATAAPVAVEPEDTLLNAAQAAARLGVAERWVYDHAEQIGGRRLSLRCRRLSSAAVERFLKRRSA
jgi:hypothetical protein